MREEGTVRGALLLESPGRLVLDEIGVDRPLAHEVLVQTSAAGCCHTDLHVMRGLLPAKLPTVLGHEASGVVVAVGEEVSYVAPGDHVVGCLTPFCGRCEYCLRGQLTQCQFTGFQRPEGVPARLSYRAGPAHQYFNISAFAEAMLLHENALVKIDKSVPMEHAALMGCSVMTGIGAVVRAAKVEAGASMAVVGCGGVGLNVLQGGRLVGARCIVGVDTSTEKLEMAKRFGATIVVDASNEDAVAAVRAATGGGVDYAFEAVGKKLTVEQSIAMLRPGGLATIAGVMPAGMTFEVGGEKLLDGEYRIQGTKLGTNRFRTDIPRYLELYQEGRIELEALISERIALDDVNDAYDMLEIGAAARSVIVFK